ncbi:MAG: oligosaccharide flippase family protein [Deltaproteobacteria bacterium]|nr:oligosaccharide flippase family protein [Deltaproteobacteria bacterium]
MATYRETEPDETEASAKAEATARESTRGVAVIAAAKAWFMVTGFAQPIVLTRLLLGEGYGLYGVVLNVISILNNVVVAGSIQAMSHAVTDGGVTALRKGLLIHAALGLSLAGTLFAGADLLGAGVLHDTRLPPLLRIGAVVVADYSVYAALVGALNGRRRFRAQAGLDITFATLRTGLILGLAATPLRVTGAITGFAIASVLILLAALALHRDDLRAPAAGGVSTGVFARSYARFFAPVLVYQLALNLVLQADLLVMKALLSRREGVDEAAINTLAGVYKAVQNFAFLPYQLLLAVTFVVFPVVSKSTLEGDREATAGFVRGALRFSALALGAMLAVLGAMPGGVLRLAYRPPFDLGAPVLRWLSLAQGAFALSVIGTTIVLAAGRTGAATTLMAAMLAAVFAGNLVGLALSPADLSALTHTALGTLFGCLVGLVLVGTYVRRTFGAFLSITTAARVVACGVGAAAVGAWVPWPGKVGTLVGAAVVAVLYIALLVVTREVTPAEFARIRRVLRRR